MGKKQTPSIDSLFGSKTRVKLMHLFFTNPGKSFYVREITRMIDEQINSVRRELANLLSVGVIKSDTADNKLYYEINQHYEHYAAFRAIFVPDESVIAISSNGVIDAADVATSGQAKTVPKPVITASEPSWVRAMRSMKGLHAVVTAGSLVDGSASPIDLLVVGPKSRKLTEIIKKIEKEEGHELNYAIMEFDEFAYRMSVRDRFVNELVANRHEVIIDNDAILTNLS